MHDTRVGLRGEVIVIVRKNRHDIGIGAVLIEVLRQSTSACMIELMTEQQDSAPAETDL
ncbi:MAG: hypothetical protein JO249_26165 [Acidobacteria bacterium]|nr:hypothetical protein [Acidobacteriota bacterium]